MITACPRTGGRTCRSSPRRTRRAVCERLLERRPRQLDLGPVVARRVDLRHRRVLRHEDRAPARRARAQPRQRPDRGCRRSRRRRPAARRSGSRLESLVYAPRTLNEPVRCRFSALRDTGRPDEPRERLGREDRRDARDSRRAARVRARSQEVRVRSPSPSWIRNTFSSISRTAVSGSSSRACTSASSRRSSAIVGDRLARGDGSPDSTRPRTPRARDSRDAAPRAVRSRSRNARCSSIFSHSSGTCSPRTASVRTIGGFHSRLAVESEDRAHLVQHRLRGGIVHLVDRDHVGDLHDPGLQRLHRVAGAGHEDEEDRVGDPDHLDLALARADRLEEDDVLAGRVEHEQRLQRRLGETAEVAARPHRADEDVGVEEVVGEPDPVAEQRAVRERARGIDRDDADRAAHARGRDGSAPRRGSTCRRRAAR